MARLVETSDPQPGVDGVRTWRRSRAPGQR